MNWFTKLFKLKPMTPTEALETLISHNPTFRYRILEAHNYYPTTAELLCQTYIEYTIVAENSKNICTLQGFDFASIFSKMLQTLPHATNL